MSPAGFSELSGSKGTDINDYFMRDYKWRRPCDENNGMSPGARRKST